MNGEEDGAAGRIQRVRVGLTGLACVFLLVMLATAFVRMAGDRPGAIDGAAVANAAEAPPSEPLAQLGVAPGNLPAEEAKPPIAKGAKPIRR